MLVGVLDFFCGCGGASSGFAKAEVDGVSVSIVAGVDIDPHSCATFRRMLRAHCERVDIRELVENTRLFSRLVASWQLERFDKIVLIGCAPCQGFAAHRKSVAGQDERRSLFVDFCRLAARLHPDAIFIENVPDMFSERHWPHYDKGRKLLEDAALVTRGRIFNFAGFGLPQERFRAVILALRQNFPLPEAALGPAQYKVVRDAIGSLPALAAGESCPNDPMHIVSKHRRETIGILAKVPKNGGNRPLGVGPKCLDRARQQFGGYTDVYGRLAWDRPSVTITARCRTPSCGRFVHPEQNRGLSVREAALLQGFPHDYYFEGPFDDKYKQIGNAVPPIIAKRFAEHILGLLREGDCLPLEPSGDADDVHAPVGRGFAVTINGIKKRRSREIQSTLWPI